MGWAIGYDGNWQRDIGYGVPALCDHPDCNKKIDRGLSYVCAKQEPRGGEEGCGLYFCEKHSNLDGFCERCAYNEKQGDDWKKMQPPFEAKPDIKEWVEHKLNHESWAEWREENPDEVKVLKDSK